MKILSDSGYHTILPEQLYQHLTAGLLLPSKPIMITFDDSHEEHFSIAAGILEKYRFQGVFFVMTVCIGKKNYLSPIQIRSLSNRGHAIENHSYDHPPVSIIKGNQWEQQIENPKILLESIIQRPVEYFAYPYGTWNEAAIIELKKRGIKAAFQLSNKQSQQEPLYTIKRLIVPGNWSGQYLLKQMAIVFK
jgi:peptidoglycan/xylan/chitin deacetylase (PgdA/CDA1 family)